MFVALAVPGQSGMVSRDSPLAKAASICKLDALVTQADLSSDKEHAVGSCLVKHWGGKVAKRSFPRVPLLTESGICIWPGFRMRIWLLGELRQCASSARTFARQLL